jgi:hypothetical protein
MHKGRRVSKTMTASVLLLLAVLLALALVRVGLRACCCGSGGGRCCCYGETDCPSLILTGANGAGT